LFASARNYAPKIRVCVHARKAIKGSRREVDADNETLISHSPLALFRHPSRAVVVIRRQALRECSEHFSALLRSFKLAVPV